MSAEYHHSLKELLTLFSVIAVPENKTDQVYIYQHIKAWHDLDGYTCWLGYRDLTITLNFHGTNAYDFKDSDTLKQFYRHANKILASK